MDINEKDWKVLRKMLPGWQERYMEQLNKEYVEILLSDEPASTKFWKLEKRINGDKKATGVVADMRRSQMHSIIMNLLEEGVISLDDLSDFSEDLQGLMEHFYPSRSI